MESSPDMTLRESRLFALAQATKRDLNGSCNQAHARTSHGFLDCVCMSQSHNSQKRRAASAAVISNSPRPRMLPQFPDPVSSLTPFDVKLVCECAGIRNRSPARLRRLAGTVRCQICALCTPPFPMKSGMARKRSSLQVFDLQ